MFGNRVYIVEVIPFGSSKGRILQTGYRTYDAAAKSILIRPDKPSWITKFCLKSDEFDYIIHDVVIN